jgi:hypothetical protein
MAMLLGVMLVLAAAGQDVPAGTGVTTAADGTQRWSILADPCTRSAVEDIVVCGQGTAPNPRLGPDVDRGVPDHATPGNPDRSGMGALALTSAPCATRSEGCTTGIDLFGGGTALIRGIGKIIDPDSCCEEPGEATNPFKLVGDAVKGVGRTFRKKPDKSKRVPIPLD